MLPATRQRDSNSRMLYSCSLGEPRDHGVLNKIRKTDSDEAVKRRTKQSVLRTHTFALERVEEVAAHLAVVPRCARRVIHACHVAGRVLQGGGGQAREGLSAFIQLQLHPVYAAAYTVYI